MQLSIPSQKSGTHLFMNLLQKLLNDLVMAFALFQSERNFSWCSLIRKKDTQLAKFKPYKI